MSPVNYKDNTDAKEIRINHVEQVDWVEWAKAQALNQKVQIENQFTNREDFHQREITEIEFKKTDSRDECIQQLKSALSVMFNDSYVERELVEERGVIRELVDEARESTSTTSEIGENAGDE
ncbi:MAG: hypothetical protein J07HX64_01288 [halophilic archaeon J07HX64]|nr:MAG: hypothetical protein J07HX64_01288 [halophilic archaeon J07HX64]